jgi:hypothetical protein
MDRLRQAQAELAERNAEPWQQKLEAAVRGKDAISTVALMELIGCPKNTASARRIAKVMRSMNFIPLKSRRLVPGGFRDTTARGWSRPIREARNAVPHPAPKAVATGVDQQWGLT